MNEKREPISQAPRKPEPWSPPKPLPGPLLTERLTLRFYDESDAPKLYEAVNADRASLAPWLPWAHTENRTIGESHYTIERFRRGHELPACDNFAIGIFDTATGEMLGGTGFHRIMAEIGQGEIGYWIRGDRAKRGYCTEATAAMISWAFSPQDRGGWGFRRVTVIVAGPNVASRRVPEKLRLRRELTARADRWVDGLGFVDTLGWGVTSDEWDIEGRQQAPLQRDEAP